MQTIKRRLSSALLVVISISTSLCPVAAVAKPRDVGSHMGVCPVSMDSVRIDHNVLFFYYQNTAGKDVDGVMFDAAYYDRDLRPHHMDVWGTYNDLVHPGKYKKGALSIRFLRDHGYGGIALWPKKVLYPDGTSWDMATNGESCAVIQKGKQQQAGLLPPETGISLIAVNTH